MNNEMTRREVGKILGSFAVLPVFGNLPSLDLDKLPEGDLMLDYRCDKSPEELVELCGPGNEYAHLLTMTIYYTGNRWQSYHFYEYSDQGTPKELRLKRTNGVWEKQDDQ